MNIQINQLLNDLNQSKGIDSYAKLAHAAKLAGGPGALLNKVYTLGQINNSNSFVNQITHLLSMVNKLN